MSLVSSNEPPTYKFSLTNPMDEQTKSKINKSNKTFVFDECFKKSIRAFCANLFILSVDHVR